MHRIDHSTANAGQFVQGNPATSVAATVVTAAWLNDVQEQLAFLIEAAGIALTKNRDADLRDAMNALYAQLAGANFTGLLRAQYADPVIQAEDTGGLNRSIRFRILTDLARIQVDADQPLRLEGEGGTAMGDLELRDPTGLQTVLHSGNLSTYFPGTIAANGEQSLGSGLILKYGRITSPALETNTIHPFPVAFPSACRVVMLTGENSDGSTQRATEPQVVARTAANFTYRAQQMDSSATNVTAISYMAIGN
ncbi:MAG: hypothetical protein AAGF44_07170 [Pseudomonadota bacterium]